MGLIAFPPATERINVASSLPLPNETDEIRWVSAAAQGDKTAFEVLVRAYQGPLHALIARYVWDRDDVSDLVQDVFIRAFKGLPSYDVSRPFGPWLRSIARNRVVDHLRARASTSRHRELDRHLADAIGNAAEETSEERRAAALARCLDRLPSHHRELLRDRYERGVSVNSIALRDKRSATSVSMVLMRIRHALAKCMELDAPQPKVSV